MPHSRDVIIEAGGARLHGRLDVPEGCTGLVVFSHGSGSSRFSPRNQAVAAFLNRGALGTLLLDLLTADESVTDGLTGEYRFDIDLLTRRLTGAVDWLSSQPELAALPVGLFGSSTGAASALNTAASRPEIVGAVVSRGGRADLAMPSLPLVRAPTLLIVGERDETVITMNREAAIRLRAEHALAIVPGATHLFEEPGTLEEVARLARDWFGRHLVRTPARGVAAGGR